MGKRVFGAGLIAADHIYLKKGRRKEPKYLGTSGGGSVGNTLAMLTLLGHDCEVFGVTGNDLVSNIIRSDFDLFGISHSLLRKRGKPNRYVKSRQYSHLIDENRQKHAFKRICLSCGEKFTRDFQLAKRDYTPSVWETATSADAVHLDRANRITVDLAVECGKQTQHRLKAGLGIGRAGVGEGAAAARGQPVVTGQLGVSGDHLREFWTADG